MNQPVDIHGKTYHRGWLVMVLLVGNFCTMLNQTILSTAFPTLMKAFDVSASTVQWLTTGFMLVNGIMIPISAWLFSKFKTRHLYLSAMMIFLLGTTICFLSPSFPVLLIGRLIQATAVGISIPMVQTIMLSIFPPEKRGTAMGLSGLVVGLAPALGPTLSGWVIDQYQWRDLFGMIIPIVIFVIILAIFFMKDVLPNHNEKISVSSIILSTIGFGSLLYGFSSVGDKGWSSPVVIIALIIGVVFIGLFSWYQLHMEHPLLDIRVFQEWRFTLATIASGMVFLVMIGVEMVLPMYIQNIRGQSAFHSGLLLLPGALLTGIVMPITGRIFDKRGIQRLGATGLFLASVGTIPLLFLTKNTPLSFITVVYAIRMFGIAMAMMPITTFGMNALPTHLMSHATAVNNTFRQVMGSVGTAILVSVLTSTTKNDMPSTALMKQDVLSFKDHMISATITGYHATFFISILFGLFGFVVALFLRNKKEGDNAC